MNKHKATKLICRIWKEWRMTIFFIVFVIIPAKSSFAGMTKRNWWAQPTLPCYLVGGLTMTFLRYKKIWTPDNDFLGSALHYERIRFFAKYLYAITPEEIV